MKVRTSFVANSSNSSFIIVGVKASELGKDFIKREAFHGTVELFMDNTIFGIAILNWDNEIIEIKDSTFAAIERAKKELREILDKNEEHGEIKMFAGTEYS